MWNYEKRLEYPINIKETNPKIAKFIMSQYGGPYCISLFFEKNKPFYDLYFDYRHVYFGGNQYEQKR